MTEYQAWRFVRSRAKVAIKEAKCEEFAPHWGLCHAMWSLLRHSTEGNISENQCELMEARLPKTRRMKDTAYAWPQTVVGHQRRVAFCTMQMQAALGRSRKVKWEHAR